MKRDPLHSLKLKAYTRTFGPPEGTMNFRELVHHAQSYLSRETRTLCNDPVWDLYTPEEIVIEYFGHRFAKDPDLLDEFKKTIKIKDADVEEFDDWVEQQIKNNEIEMQEALTQEDSISFKPEDL